MSHLPNELLVFDKRLKLGASRDGQVQSLGREERLHVKQVEVVIINKVCEQLVAKAIQRGHDRQGQVPTSVCGSVHHPTGQQLEHSRHSQ